MKDQIHEHIISELKSNTQTDRIFVLSAIVLNLITMAINAAIAGTSSESLLIMFIFVILILVVNIVAEVGLIKGRQTREKLLNGLIQMYKDHGVDQYYDSSLLSSYRTRYNLFMLTVLCSGLVAVVVPFLGL